MFKAFSVIALFLALSTNTLAAITTFDPAPLPGGSRLETSYSKNGVSFSGSFGHGSSLNSGRASNRSSGYLEFLFSSTLRIEMADSSLFSLGFVDLSEYSTAFIAPRTITFTGYLSDGASVSQTFITDGLFDSIGGIDDFETFTFGSAFSIQQFSLC